MSFPLFVRVPPTYGEPLCVIGLSAAEQGLEGVVGWDREPGRVHQKLAGNVKEDEEEVKGAESEDDVDFGDAGLLLEVVEGWVLGQRPSVVVSLACVSFAEMRRMGSTHLSSCERWYWALRPLLAVYYGAYGGR